MNLKFFTIPVWNAATPEAELTAFCSNHTVIDIERHFVENGGKAYWAVCVIWTEAGSGAPKRDSSARNKIDYKEVLSPEDFQIYAQLRELRKTLAERDGVPPYAVMTNEQLARMVRERMTTRGALRKMPGVGPARVDKYGAALIERLQELLGRGKGDEADAD